MKDDISTESESTCIGVEDNHSEASTDSSFYGTSTVKQRYEAYAKETNYDAYWDVHDWNIQVMAARAVQRDPDPWTISNNKRNREGEVHDNTSSNKRSKHENESADIVDMTLRPLSSKPFNPYEDVPSALKLNEKVDDFLRRLKPSCADTDQPWIWCANFSAEQREDSGNLSVFRQTGTRLLENFMAKRQKLEASFDPPKLAGSITRMLGPDRLILEEDIKQAAKKNGVVSGKWMLFPTSEKVDRYWSAVVRGTVDGRLGMAAKVATRPDKPEDPSRVICIYTQDFEDEADIKRVLKELVRLRLAPAIPGPLQKGAGVVGQIWYKPDCYTHLGLLSTNEYKIKPTLYSTSSLLRAHDL